MNEVKSFQKIVNSDMENYQVEERKKDKMFSDIMQSVNKKQESRRLPENNNLTVENELENSGLEC